MKQLNNKTIEQLSNSERKLGFTLIELVVAMAIIAVIAGTIWGNFFPSLRKGRDTRRKEDLQSIARALELYYNDSGSYPNSTNPLPNWGLAFNNPSNQSVIYMQKLPNDPSYPNKSYCYLSDNNGTYYKIYADLENMNDAEVFSTEVACGGDWYNYGISSPNTTP